MTENKKSLLKTDYVFEVSWEVCNKVGGIYTVVSTKATLMQEKFGDHFIMLGPDLYKGSRGNIEFIEDDELFKEWKGQFNTDGIKIRVGKWDIPSKPITILIDFSPLFVMKDQIFGDLWSKNRLDSLSGGWDYIEPALFGFAAGKVIEDLKGFYFTKGNQVIAHFHEWMTGAGILYLENMVPEIATVFTTHATVVGRALCNSAQPFYSRFDTYNGDQVANSFNTVAKHSLEKTSAITADVFTTVSNNTARECQQLLGKGVDKVTTNAFDDTFVPKTNLFDEKRNQAREKLLQVASSAVGYKLKKDSFLVATSGRYEYKNKGIDLFVDAISGLGIKTELKKDIIAFVIVPAAHTSPVSEIMEALKSDHQNEDHKPSSILTHYLQDPGHDRIWQQIKNSSLKNEIDQRTKIIYAPIYLNGNDGVFDLPYYDILIGFDLTVFPSYYEPFGYTPLESLSFHVPTVTTTLTGFGQQVKSKIKNSKEGMLVIERSDFNDQTVIDQIANHIYEFSTKTNSELEAAREKAYKISRSFLWRNLINNYDQVYSMALERHMLKIKSLEHFLEIVPKSYTAPAKSNEPIWKSAMVKFRIPKALQDLETLSNNLWWTWHPKVNELFMYIDADLWEAVGHNPIALLTLLDYQRFLELEKDEKFREQLKHMIADFNGYMASKIEKPSPKVAYLCMEYGLHESLPIYAGGLGILAGDFLKEASDMGTDIVAFGLLYRYGYFKQSLTLQGAQVATYKKQHFTHLPICPVMNSEGNRLIIQLPLRGPMINVQVWKVSVGHIPLYLFDTDIPENGDENKKITHHLYGGDNQNRLKQELLLAISTIELLEILDIHPDLYHYNEGHTAFTALIRIAKLVMGKNLGFDEALEFVKSSTLFTTHTPVAAGNDVFEEDLLRSYQSHLADTVNIPWERILGFGKINASNRNEQFSMSYLAARLSGEINAVSKIHAGVTQKMFSPIWKGLLDEELEIDNVTNGVHYATWTAPQWQQVFIKYFKDDFFDNISNQSYWAKAESIPSQHIIETKKKLKIELIDGIQNRLKNEIRDLHLHAARVYEIFNSLKVNDFIIGFARRFATYKRADLLFRDTDRLSKIVNHSEKPVKFIFAGKAHPADKAGQNIIQRILEVSQRPEFLGKILFVQDYDMDLARLLIQGADVWLNTPERGHEASGTSGMKAILNGTLNFSVLDGWWAEANNAECGWSLPKERIYENQSDQDDLDAETIYNILQHEIIPEYYDINEKGISEKWIARIKKGFVNIAPHFTMSRVLDQYKTNYYAKMYRRVKKMEENNFELTKTYVAWTKKINKEWPKISIVDVQFSNDNQSLELGEEFSAEITINLGELLATDIGVELVFAKRSKDGICFKIKEITELQLVESKKNQAVYKGEAIASFTGAFQYDIRFFPKNPMVNHRRNLPLVKWV
ncbi:alpha-glucan family phosphorylase [Maribacter sp. CXY002]|uniref:alpha-glucan family phosphorylase n=1 Tax=Maribacter luteocoastalis TaxID=3407671 RepID=UPI003B66BB8B